MPRPIPTTPIASLPLAVSATCGFCGGGVQKSTLRGVDFCSKCGLSYEPETLGIVGKEYHLLPPYEEHALECAFCKCEIGKYFVKQKPPESPSIAPTGPVYHYAERNTQVMIAYLYKEHKGACRVLQVILGR